VFSGALLVFACAGAETNKGGSGAPVLFVQDHPSDESPTGLWCVTRSGSTLAASPLVPEGDFGGDRVLVLGTERWLWRRNFEVNRAARLDGCRLEPFREVSAVEPRWSNAGAVYLDLADGGTLTVGRPGGAAFTLEAAGVVDTGWSPQHLRAWYTHGEDGPTGTPLDLFVVDVGIGLDDPPVPIPVATGVVGAQWTPDGEWLLYATTSTGGVALHAWSAAEQTSRVLSQYAGRPSIQMEPGPDSRHVLVERYRVVSIEDGLERSLVEGDGSGTTLQWLWPEPWLQYTPSDAAATLFDVSDLDDVVATTLGAPLAVLSPEAGVAVQSGNEGSPRLVSGLPGSIESGHDLPTIGAGSFSPDGRYWAAIDYAYDDAGRLKDHGGLLFVTDTSAGGGSSVVTDLDQRGPALDGIRWLDSRSFVLTLIASGGRTSLALAELAEGSWRVSEVALPGTGTMARMFVVGSDPCQASSIRRGVVLPGCAAPWR
jgi:hypothetical protein